MAKGPKYTHSHCGLKPSILDSDSSIQDFVNSVIYRYPWIFVIQSHILGKMDNWTNICQ